MIISYAITVCNEIVEIQKLIPFLLKHKRAEDEIVVLYDSKGGIEPVEEYLRAKSVNAEFMWHSGEFGGHFADWKNRLTELCSGDYIFQIDADEIPNEALINNLPAILKHNPDNEVYLVPRVNTVEGFTDEDVKRWNWNISEQGWVNYPDYQSRVFRRDGEIRWERPLHELIRGAKTYSHLPPQEELSLYHPKTKEKQEQQNKFYMDNFSKKLLTRQY